MRMSVCVRECYDKRMSPPNCLARRLSHLLDDGAKEHDAKSEIHNPCQAEEAEEIYLHMTWVC